MLRPPRSFCKGHRMKDLVDTATKIAVVLTARKQTIAIAESSTGGLISAALVAVPGASAYFLGGAVVYTLESRRTLLDLPDDALEGIRASTEPYALLAARPFRPSLGSRRGSADPGDSSPTG